MTNSLLQSMTPAELIEYCLRLSAENDAMNNYIKELRVEMACYEEYKDAQESSERAYSRLDNAESHTREYEVYLYEQREKKKQEPELNVMDLNNEPDKEQIPEFVEGDIVFVKALEGRWQIISNANSFVSSDGTELFYYHVKSLDSAKPSTRTILENSIQCLAYDVDEL